MTIAVDTQNNIWFGTAPGPYGGITKFDGTNWISYNTNNSGLTNNYAYKICIDGQGYKWIANAGCGVCEFKNQVL